MSLENLPVGYLKLKNIHKQHIKYKHCFLFTRFLSILPTDSVIQVAAVQEVTGLKTEY